MSLLDGLVSFISFLCYLLSILIVARSMASWFTTRPNNIVIIYLYRVTEPFLMPLRRILPRTGRVDLSPLLAVVLLYLIVLFLSII